MIVAIPNAIIKVLAPDGTFASTWFRFFASFVAQPPAIETVVVGASPFAYVASIAGDLVIDGGTVTTIQLTRATTTIDVGVTAGLIPMRQGDTVTITHAGAPTANFVPGL